ncbi:MAG TPA: hypothetical protein VFW16_10775 [Streptosporangiaceae bacterium]|nr:hypothetical protein [Streptosporangiaceae bacterium]
MCAILGFGGIGTATTRLMRPSGARIHAINTTCATAEDVDYIGGHRRHAPRRLSVEVE